MKLSIGLCQRIESIAILCIMVGVVICGLAAAWKSTLWMVVAAAITTLAASLMMIIKNVPLHSTPVDDSTNCE